MIKVISRSTSWAGFSVRNRGRHESGLSIRLPGTRLVAANRGQCLRVPALRRPDSGCDQQQRGLRWWLPAPADLVHRTSEPRNLELRGHHLEWAAAGSDHALGDQRCQRRWESDLLRSSAWDHLATHRTGLPDRCWWASSQFRLIPEWLM